MNVLLIAPDVGLPAAANEVRAVSFALSATLLNGHVTRKDVIDTLSAKPWDIIWFATHGDENGVMLSDGQLPTEDLTAIVRNTRAHLLVLNSCSSWSVARNIHYDLERRIEIVCTQGPEKDLTAFQTGTLFARNLAKNMTAKEAYEQSKPGGNTLYFFFGKEDHSPTDDQEAALLALIRQEFGKIYRAIEEVERKIVRRVDTLEQRFNDGMEKLEAAYTNADKRIYAIEYAAARISPSDKLTGLIVLLAMLTMLGIYLWSNIG